MLNKENTMTKQNLNDKKQGDETIAEKDQVEDNVGNAGYVPNHGMLNKENIMTPQNITNNKN
jgi:hypothetical protein